MKDKMVPIPQGAIEETIQACSYELQHVYDKQNKSFLETLIRFLWMDLHTYMIASLLMLMVILLISILIPESKSVPFIIYFGFLGCLHIFEMYKNNKYDMEELCGPVYLHKGRVFLYKNASFAFFEILTCILFGLYSNVFIGNQTFIILINGFIPLLFCQIWMLFLLQFIHHMYTSFVVYLLLFVGYTVLYTVFDEVLLQIINIGIAYILCLVLVAVFMLEVWYLHNRKGEYNGINFKAY